MSCSSCNAKRRRSNRLDRALTAWIVLSTRTTVACACMIETVLRGCAVASPRSISVCGTCFRAYLDRAFPCDSQVTPYLDTYPFSSASRAPVSIEAGGRRPELPPAGLSWRRASNLLRASLSLLTSMSCYNADFPPSCRRHYDQLRSMTILQVPNDLQTEPSSRKRHARGSDDKAVSVGPWLDGRK